MIVPRRLSIRGCALLSLWVFGCSEPPPPPPPAPAPAPAPVAAPEPVVEVPRIFADVVWARGLPTGIVPLDVDTVPAQVRFHIEVLPDGFEVTRVAPGGAVDYRWRSRAGDAGVQRVEHLDSDGVLVRLDQILDAGVKVLRQDGEGGRLVAPCASYALELDDGGRTIAESCIGDAGAPIADDSGIATRRFTLDTLGRRVEERTFLEGGRPVAPRGRRYVRLRRVWDDAGRLIQRLRLGADGHPVTDGFASEEWDYDDQGRLVEHRYEAADGALIVGPEGWAKETRRDEDGQTVIATFGVDGSLTRRRGGGVARSVERRDEGGRLLSRRVYDREGQPTVTREGRVHRVTHQYDAEGRRVHTAWFGPHERPTYHVGRRIEGERIERDAEGREVARPCLAGNGRPVAGPQGWMRRITQYNSAGKVETISYQGRDGESVGRAEDGVAKLFHYYDLKGNLSQVASSGPTGKAIAQKGGFARAVWEYDDAGRVVAEAWFDGGEAPMTHGLRDCARETIAYDVNGFEAERRCFNTDGEPVVSSVMGVAGWRWQRDGQGRVMRKTALSVSGEVGVTRHGHAVEMTRYDGRGEVLSVSFLDAEGRPAFGAEGWSERRWRRDAQGQVTEVSTVDTLGNLVPDPLGVARTRTSRDGYTTRIRYQGVDSQPVGGVGGVAGRDITTDAYGMVVREMTVDVSGLPRVEPATGCATVETTRDAAGDVIATRCLDAHGLPLIGRDGWATRRVERNAAGFVTGISLHDGAGELIDGREGWARELRSVDARGWVGRLERIRVDGSTVGTERIYDRDTQGQVVRESSWSGRGGLTVNDEGWAMRFVAYDALGRVLSDSFAGVDPDSEQSFSGHSTYGLGGRLVETRLVASVGKPTLGPEGWSIRRHSHDARGRLVAVRYFDETDTPGLKGHPHVGERHVRDAMGRLLERRAMAAKGVLVDGFGLGKQRWAIERQRFDALGRRTSRSFFDVDDRPVPGEDGVHALHWTWNARGQMSVQERWVAPNKPAPGGWARQVHDYDRYGRLIGISYQDAMGQAATVWNGVGRVELTHGRDGRLATMSWFGPGGEVMDAKVCFPGTYCAKRPVHQARYRYEDSDDPVTMTLFDRKGTQRKTLDCAKGECF